MPWRLEQHSDGPSDSSEWNAEHPEFRLHHQPLSREFPLITDKKRLLYAQQP
jgi:hypothetical protein